MTVGILALQGDFAEHSSVIHLLGHTPIEIRSLTDCTTHNITHLIIPGGESTVIARHLKETGIGEWMTKEAQKGSLAIFGTCAGAIILASEATGKNAPETLHLLDISVDRNAYGTQRDSFETELLVSGIDHPIHTAFIRAPRITRVGESVSVLATYGSEPVIVRSGRIMAATCHPEVRGETAVHQFFLSL